MNSFGGGTIKYIFSITVSLTKRSMKVSNICASLIDLLALNEKSLKPGG